MPKLKSISWYKKKCDEELSRLVREKGFCERCGKTDKQFLQHAHVIPRTNSTLRWDIINALCLCYSCHIFFWHKNPLDASNWFRDKFPARYEYLQATRNKYVKRTQEDYQILLQEIRAKNLKNLVIGTKIAS